MRRESEGASTSQSGPPCILGPTLQVLVTLALILVEYFAVRWLERKLWDT
jgi:hypothetical protein